MKPLDFSRMHGYLKGSCSQWEAKKETDSYQKAFKESSGI